MNRLNEKTIFWLKRGLYDMISEEDKKLIKKMCTEHNMPLETFLNRIRGRMTIEEALSIPIPRSGYKCHNIIKEVEEYDGFHYETVTEIYKKYGLTRQTFYARYNSGWSIKDILELPAASDKNVKEVLKERTLRSDKL